MSSYIIPQVTQWPRFLETGTWPCAQRKREVQTGGKSCLGLVTRLELVPNHDLALTELPCPRGTQLVGEAPRRAPGTWRGTHSQVPWGACVMGWGGVGRATEERQCERERERLREKKRQRNREQGGKERKKGSGGQEREEGIMDSAPFSEQSPSRGMEEQMAHSASFDRSIKTWATLFPAGPGPGCQALLGSPW